jgi:hypothetical protein
MNVSLSNASFCVLGYFLITKLVLYTHFAMNILLENFTFPTKIDFCVVCPKSLIAV